MSTWWSHYCVMQRQAFLLCHCTGKPFHVGVNSYNTYNATARSEQTCHCVVKSTVRAWRML